MRLVDLKRVDEPVEQGNVPTSGCAFNAADRRIHVSQRSWTRGTEQCLRTKNLKLIARRSVRSRLSGLELPVRMDNQAQRDSASAESYL